MVPDGAGGGFCVSCHRDCWMVAATIVINGMPPRRSAALPSDTAQMELCHA